MAETIPSTLIISNVSIKHNIPTFYNESINLKGNSTDRGIHRLEGTLDLTTTSNKDKRQLEAFLMRLRGRSGEFFLSLPDRFTALDQDLDLAVSTNGAHNIGDTSLTLSIFDGVITEGDMFTIANDKKIYIATTSSELSSTIEIYPPLHKAAADALLVDFGSPTILARLVDDMQTIDYSESGMIHTISLNWVEAL